MSYCNIMGATIKEKDIQHFITLRQSAISKQLTNHCILTTICFHPLIDTFKSDIPNQQYSLITSIDCSKNCN